MGLIIHLLLLLGSFAALSAAGWRLASAAVPSGYSGRSRPFPSRGRRCALGARARARRAGREPGCAHRGRSGDLPRHLASGSGTATVGYPGRLVVPLMLAAGGGRDRGRRVVPTDLIDHGSPFWPLSTTPWGDPIPPAFRAVDASRLSKFHATLHGRVDDYWRALAGRVVLIAGALIAPLWRDASRSPGAP
ncbi:MAG: hypothetical protein M3071_10630 [Actinomycetota bacterium]|nr:hypothetical protein [Actinomycetota bacterium]